ncbi:MAG: hypothetical protein U0270_34715 [Labilithrix sp.]
MSANIAKLIKEANASIKRDAKAAVEKLEEAYALAKQAGNDEDTAFVAEELARAWPRRKKVARALYYAHKASKLAPNQRTSWTTLAKTCELVANRQKRETKKARMMALFRVAAEGFKKAAGMTKDPEDKRWLQELGADAAKQAKGEFLPPPRQK